MVAPNGAVFLNRRDQGDVVMLRDADGYGTADGGVIVANRVGEASALSDAKVAEVQLFHFTDPGGDRMLEGCISRDFFGRRRPSVNDNGGDGRERLRRKGNACSS